MKSWLCATVLMVWSMSLTAGEPAPKQVDVGAYRITVPSNWMAATGRNKRLIAMRFTDEKQTQRLGEILAATLAKSATEESDEIIAGIKNKPDTGTIVESGEFTTKKGAKGKKVLIKLNDSDAIYGKPNILYSIYLPQLEGSVTFKLRCGEKEFEANKTDFENMLSAAEAAPAKP